MLIKKYYNNIIMINKLIYNIICLCRNESSFDFINKLAKIDDYNEIIPNLWILRVYVK